MMGTAFRGVVCRYCAFARSSLIRCYSSYQRLSLDLFPRASSPIKSHRSLRQALQASEGGIFLTLTRSRPETSVPCATSLSSASTPSQAESWIPGDFIVSGDAWLVPTTSSTVPVFRRADSSSLFVLDADSCSSRPLGILCDSLSPVNPSCSNDDGSSSSHGSEDDIHPIGRLQDRRGADNWQMQGYVTTPLFARM